jgi:hypothetical protein
MYLSTVLYDNWWWCWLWLKTCMKARKAIHICVPIDGLFLSDQLAVALVHDMSAFYAFRINPEANYSLPMSRPLHCCALYPHRADGSSGWTDISHLCSCRTDSLPSRRYSLGCLRDGFTAGRYQYIDGTSSVPSMREEAVAHSCFQRCDRVICGMFGAGGGGGGRDRSSRRRRRRRKE